MAKISLQNYINNIDQMLDDNQFNDVVQHCLHILKLYPRHLDTYRALGKAFLGLRKNNEAINLFQRVLSADPNDLYAHIALSDMYRTEMQADLSNWHLQRALELDPYNEAIQAEYRDVFYTQEDDDFAAERIPLNFPALGKIYLSGELFGQATAVLQKSLAESPDRIDQEVVLAEALWREGDDNEAEAVCHRVLEKLPYCLNANAILSDIWLKENRTSAAQPLLRIVQSMVQWDQANVDIDSPAGRALTSTGAPPLPNQIMIDMWDETAVSPVSEQPTADWVSEIPFGDTTGADESFAEADITSEPGDMYGWLKGVTAELRGEPPLEPRPEKEETAKGETDWFVDKAIEDSATSPDDHSVTAWLEGQRAGVNNGDLSEEESDQPVPSPLPDWLSSSNQADMNVSEEQPESAAEQGDVPDWLNEVSDSDFEPIQYDPDSASQWLEDSVESESEIESATEDESVDEAADWLAELSGEIDELTSAPLDPEAAGVEPLEEEETAVSEKTTSDTTDWLNNLSSEEDGMGGDDWLAALSDDTDHSDETVSEREEGIVESKDAESDDSFFTDDNDWLSALDAVPEETIVETGDLAGIDDDWLGALDAAPEETIAETGDLADVSDDWLNDLTGEDVLPEPPISEESDSLLEEQSKFDSEDLLAALAGEEELSEPDVIDSTVSEADPLDDDWLAALAGDEIEKAADTQAQETSIEEDIDDDWLSELEKGTNMLASEPDELEETLAEDSEIFTEGSLTDWLSGDDLDALSDDSKSVVEEPAQEVEASLTDWLSGDDLDELAEDEAGEVEKPVEETVASLTAWLSGDDLTDLSDEVSDEVEEPTEEVESSLTDWLSGNEFEELSNDVDSVTDEPVEDAESSLTDWLSGEEAESLEDEILAGMKFEESTPVDLPTIEEESDDPAEISVTDWLSGELVDEIEDLEASEMSSLGDENDREQTDLPKPESEETPSDDMMDWLADLESADELEAEPAEEADIELTKSTSDILEPDQTELPDWLSKAAEIEDDEIAIPSDADIPDWLNADSDLPEEKALSEFNIESTFEGTTELPGPPTSLLDELESTLQTPEEIPTTEEEVSWLSELAAESDDGGDTTALDWLGDDQDDDSLLDWMDDLDSVVKETGSLEPVGPDTSGEDDEMETAVSDEDDDYALPDDIPSDLDDAMSWLEDLAAEESAPVQPLPTVADVLDEGLSDLFESDESADEPAEPILEIDEPETKSDLDFLEEELFGQVEDEAENVLDDLSEPVEQDEIDPSDLSFLEDELFNLQDDVEDVSPVVAEVEELDTSDVAEDLSFLEEDLFGFVEDEDEAAPVTDVEETYENGTEADLSFLEEELFESDEAVESEPVTEIEDLLDDSFELDTTILEEETPGFDVEFEAEEEPEPDPLTATKIMAPIEDESESVDSVVPGDGFTEELADLDEAMAWLDNMAAEGDVLDELPLDEAEVVPEPVEEADTYANVLEESGLSTENSSAVEDAISDVPEDLDDAMAWLETLAAKQGAPIEELPSLRQDEDEQQTEPEPVVSSDDILESDDDPLAEPINMTFDDEPAGDELLETIPDVPEDLDDAMAWLEELAAKQGAPIEELPSLSGEMDSASEPSPVADEMPETVPELIEEPAVEIDSDLLAALDWLDDEVADGDGDVAETAVFETSDTDLLAALDQLEQLALQTEPEPEPEPVAEPPEDDALTTDIFDMPDDPDEALAWLEEMSDEAGGEETAVPETVVIEPDPVVEEEPALESVAEVADDSEDLAALDIFDMPDDPDEALAWLEEVGDDTPAPVTEPPTTVVIDPEEIQELASESSAEVEPDTVAEEAADPAEDIGGDLDDIFGAFDMPDDPDAALAWLEEVSDDDAPAVGKTETAVIDDPELIKETPPATAAEEPAEEAVDLTEEFLSDVPEDPDEAMAWLEQLAARQGADLDELPTVTEQPIDEDIETPDWIAAAAEQAEASVQTESEEIIPEIVEETREPEVEISTELAADLQELDDILPDDELEEIPGTDELDEALPSWLEADDNSVAIPSQTDWLSDLPEPDVTGWLAAEAEVSGTGSEGTGPLPETGPLFESVISDTSPLETGPIAEPEDELPAISETDELSSSMFEIDEDQLDSARDSLSEGKSEEAVSIYRDLVSKGGGLMMLINELETVSTDYPEQREVRRLLGDAYMRNGQLQKALFTYREALDQL